MQVRVHEAVREVPRAAWDALVGDEPPFLEWDWLSALEESGCVAPETGWRPQHLTVWDGDDLVGACPLYLKGHSDGEFVFDWGWASAAERAGIRYYPKLLAAVPFTPVTGARFLARPDVRNGVTGTLAAVLEEVCGDLGLSSAHVNFCRPDEGDALVARGWLRRTGFQYQWRNAGHRTFDDYLAGLRSKRRNQVVRERRELAAQGVTIAVYAGDAIGADLVPVMFDLYRTTVVENPWGQQYLNRRFFRLLHERFRDRLCFIVARQDGDVVAGTFNVQKAPAFYGRYWGTFRSLRHLHFNVCYYAAIEHCIATGLERFEPGAGGAFKHARGFDARATESAHWIRDPRLRAAVRDALARERRTVAQQLDLLEEHTAHRRGPSSSADE
jgi:predicted N-acyltransferase